MYISSIIERLAESTSTKKKKEILLENVDNTLLKEVFFLALSPTIQFNIKKIPEYSPYYIFNLPGPRYILQDALDRLKESVRNNIRGNELIGEIKNIFENLEKNDADIFRRVIQRDLECGVSEKTANSVWEGLIYEYPCMLCDSVNEKTIKKIQWPAIVDTKMDGFRVNFSVENNMVRVLSRNGKMLHGFEMLNESFCRISNGKDYVFDGELIVIDDFGNYIDRKTGNGLINKFVKGTGTDEIAKNLVVVLWDIIAMKDFKEEYSSVPYLTRVHNLRELMKKNDNKNIRIVEHSIADSFEDAEKIFEKRIKEGKEGIIIKNSSGAWENKRSKHCLKMKAEKECDLKVINFLLGEGKYKGILGAISCMDASGTIRVNVGSGFTDEQRKKFDKKIIGQIVAIKYNEIISSKKGQARSLFLPIFQEIRTDKTIADDMRKLK